MAVVGNTPEAAAEELLRRRFARKDPAAYTEYCLDVIPALHHKLILNALMDALNGGCDRIRIHAPPGHAKSFYASVVFPSLALALQPDFRVIGVSHTDKLAFKWSRRVRKIIDSKRYRMLWGFGLSPESTAVEMWATEKGGEYVAIGVNTGSAGHRGNLVVIDDPYPNAEHAASPAYREQVLTLYAEDIVPRLLPGGIVVVIHTRWQEDDLGGWLDEQEAAGGDKWTKIILPAFAEENDILGRPVGEALWPGFFSAEHLRRIQKLQTPRAWSALYQQRPVPESGDFFKREWIKYYQRKPDNLRIYMSSDYAVTPDGGDYTVFIIGGVDERGDLYILDLWRGQKDSHEWMEVALRLCRDWDPQVWVEESGPVWRATNPFIIRRMHETNTFKYRKQLASIADKRTRATAIADRMSMGKVLFPERAPWLAEFERELLSFDAGKHDDQVDAFALLGRMLHTMVPAKPKEKSQEELNAELIQALKHPQRPTINDLLKERERNLAGIRLGLMVR